MSAERAQHECSDSTAGSLRGEHPAVIRPLRSIGPDGRSAFGWDDTLTTEAGCDGERPAPPDTLYVRRIKPALDRCLAAVGLVMALPVFAAVACTVQLTLGRPIIFVQLRVGQHGKCFPVYKFRTMHPDRRRSPQVATLDRRRTHKSEHDPRHTRVGRLLRRWSLDELPQLINVVRGEMSLVGPRPELPHIVAQYEPVERRRHLVRPGLTGEWQVNARGAGSMRERIDLDLRYVERCGPRRDLLILARTVPAMLGRHKGQ